MSSSAITLINYEQQWNQLQERAKISCIGGDEGIVPPEEDPFDCQDVAIPSTSVRAKELNTEFIQKWRDLDSRKVSRVRHPHWFEKHVRLPEGFKFDEPPTAGVDDDNDDMEDRAASLENPMETVPYTPELRNLFQQIPLETDIDKQAITDHKLPNVARINKEIVTSDRSLDAHALGRLRVNDMHDPYIPIDSSKPMVATLRLEFLRGQPLRGFRSDANRMVLEFAGFHTLLDVHTSVCSFVEDPLWESIQQEKDEGTESGYFFIEGDFYTAGNVDYVSTVTPWLGRAGSRFSATRQKKLGLTRMPAVYSMRETSLSQLSCRLGVRYSHVFHGNVESALFMTDRRFVNSSTEFPILHDLWTFIASLPECEACEDKDAKDKKRATVVTSTECEITGGHRALCAECCRALRIPTQHIRSFHAWRSETDLTTTK